MSIKQVYKRGIEASRKRAAEPASPQRKASEALHVYLTPDEMARARELAERLHLSLRAIVVAGLEQLELANTNPAGAPGAEVVANSQIGSPQYALATSTRVTELEKQVADLVRRIDAWGVRP